MKFLVIFTLNIAHFVSSQSATCEYHNHNFVYGSSYLLDGYTCKLTMRNAADTFQIDGQHMNDKTDDDVQGIRIDEKFKIFPALSLCNKFNNIRWILLSDGGIEEIDEDSLKNCNNLEWLNLTKNKITKLPANIFESLSKLRVLYLDENQIENIPYGIFAPLKSLEYLSMNHNNITTIHSSSFGKHPKFHEFHFYKNQLNSFDEQIIYNNTGIVSIYAHSNPCVDRDDIVRDNTPLKSDIREALTRCFENYKREFPSKAEESATIKELTHENHELKAIVNELIKNDEEIEGKIQAIINDITTIENDQIRSLNNKNEELNEEIHKMQIENANNQQIMSDRMIELNDKVNESNHEFQAKKLDRLFIFKREIRELKSDNGNLTTSIEDLRDENRVIQANLQTMTDLIYVNSKLNNVVEKIQEDDVENHQIIQSMNQQIIELTDTVRKLQEFIEDLKKKNDELRADNLEAKQANDENILSIINQLANLSNKTDDEIESVRVENHETQAALEALKTKHVELISKVDVIHAFKELHEKKHNYLSEIEVAK